MDEQPKTAEGVSVAKSKPSRARTIPRKFLDGEVDLPNTESAAASSSTSDKVVEPTAPEVAEVPSKSRARAVKIEAPVVDSTPKKDEETPKRSAPPTPTPRKVLTEERPKRQPQAKKEASVKKEVPAKTAKKVRKQSAKSDKPKKPKVEYDLHGTTFLVCERRPDHLNSCCFCVDTPRVKKEKEEEMDTETEKKDEKNVTPMEDGDEKDREDSEMSVEMNGDQAEVKEEEKKEVKKVVKVKKEEKVEEKLDPAYMRCSFPKCNQIMHKQCATEFICGEYSPGQAQLLFCTDGPVCPSHFCWHCYEERKKNSSRFGELVDCEQCMRSFHVECVPAGCKIIGKKQPKARKTFICHHHSSPKEIKKNMRMKFCLECWNVEKGELFDCETCTNVFHKKCSYKVVKGPGSEKYNHNQCTSCLTGTVIVPGQRVLAYCNVSFKGLKKGNYPGVAVRLDEVPSALHRDLGANYGKPGYIVVKWFWQGLDTAYYNVIHKSAVQRLILGCEKNLPDSDFKTELKAEEDNFNAPTRGLDHEAMRKTVKIVTSNVFSSKAPRSSVQVTKDHYACECKEDPITKIKCNTDACLNRGTQVECSKECDAKEGVFCANRGLQRGDGKGFEKKYEVKMAPDDKGWGIFATTDIKPLDFVFEYAGEVLTEDEWKAREGRLSQLRAYDEYTYMMGLTRQLIVDARFKGSLARYANHSCEPNCMAQSIEVPVKMISGDKCVYEMRVRVQSRKFIKAGEEITFSYEMHKSEHLAVDYCYCGSKSCKNKIGKAKGDEDVERYEGNKRLNKECKDEEKSSPSDGDSDESDEEKENKKLQKKSVKGKGKAKPRVSVGTAQKKKEDGAKKKVEDKKRRASGSFSSPSTSRAVPAKRRK